jgi:hypothetical protein
MSQFKRDIEKKMLNPEYAYEFGRAERELEIIELLEDRLKETTLPDGALYVESVVIKQLIKLIKEDK